MPAPGDLFQLKILLAIAGADAERGALHSELLQRFRQPRRQKASADEVRQALDALLAEGLIEARERARGALAARLTDHGRARLIEQRFDQKGILQGRFTGKQVEEALATLRAELARRAAAGAAAGAAASRATSALPAETAPIEAPSVSGGNGVAPPERLLATLDALVEAERPPGRLVPVHRLRAAAALERRAFDEALWTLARRDAIRLLKRNDEGALTDDERAASFFHPVTGGLLYYARPEPR